MNKERIKQIASFLYGIIVFMMGMFLVVFSINTLYNFIVYLELWDTPLTIFIIPIFLLVLGICVMINLYDYGIYVNRGNRGNRKEYITIGLFFFILLLPFVFSDIIFINRLFVALSLIISVFSFIGD